MNGMRIGALSLLAMVATTFVAPSVARAETLGPLNYSVPEGWSEAQRGNGWIEYASPDGAAAIKVRINVAGASPMEVARNGVTARASTLKEVACNVAGRSGAIVVKQIERTKNVTAGTTTPKGGVAIILTTSPDRWQEMCAIWGAVVDNATVSSSSGQGPRREDSEAQPARPAPPAQPTLYRVELRNGSNHAPATMYFDDEQHVLGAGETKVVNVGGGNHTFKWQNANGSWSQGTWEVPKFNRFTGLAPAAPPPPQPAPQPEAPRNETLGEGSLTIDLVNMSASGAAKIVVDGRTYSIDAGNPKTLRVNPGKHVIKWQEPDGRWGEATIDVQAPMNVAGAVPGQPLSDDFTRDFSDDQLLEGARAFIYYRQTCYNLLRGADLQPKNIEQTAANIVQTARRDRKAAAWLVGITDFYAKFVEAWNNAKTDADRYQLVRICAEDMIVTFKRMKRVAAHDGMDEIDASIVAWRQQEIREEEELKAQARLIQEQNFGIMMNMMQMQHQTSMNIINNMR